MFFSTKYLHQLFTPNHSIDPSTSNIIIIILKTFSHFKTLLSLPDLLIMNFNLLSKVQIYSITKSSSWMAQIIKGTIITDVVKEYSSTKNIQLLRDIAIVFNSTLQKWCYWAMNIFLNKSNTNLNLEMVNSNLDLLDNYY